MKSDIDVLLIRQDTKTCLPSKEEIHQGDVQTQEVQVDIGRSGGMMEKKQDQLAALLPLGFQHDRGITPKSHYGADCQRMASALMLYNHPAGHDLQETIFCI